MSELASERLAARCRRMEAEGLVDIKFVVGNLEGATLEGLCAEADAMLEAHERGDSVPFSFNDSHGRRDVPLPRKAV